MSSARQDASYLQPDLEPVADGATLHSMIRAVAVSRDYGAVRAVDNVSFEVSPGEVVGFLGPNGAGKTTVLRMLSTYIPPSAGTLTVAGHDVTSEPLAKHLRRHVREPGDIDDRTVAKLALQCVVDVRPAPQIFGGAAQSAQGRA